jgi:hypothetical protein
LATSLNRKAPVRLSLVALASALFVITLVLEGVWGVQGQETLKWFLGFLATAVGCDTVRPSGSVQSMLSKVVGGAGPEVEADTDPGVADGGGAG